jgi:hypothetical protein
VLALGGLTKILNKKQMENIRLIQAEWNKYNGLVFGFIGYNDRHLISINSSWKEFFIIELFFIQFKIYDTTP